MSSFVLTRAIDSGQVEAVEFLASRKTHKSIREQIRFPCGSVFIHDGSLQEVILANRTSTSVVGGASPPAGTCPNDVAVIFVGLY